MPTGSGVGSAMATKKALVDTIGVQSLGELAFQYAFPCRLALVEWGPLAQADLYTFERGADTPSGAARVYRNNRLVADALPLETPGLGYKYGATIQFVDPLGMSNLVASAYRLNVDFRCNLWAELRAAGVLVS